VTKWEKTRKQVFSSVQFSSNQMHSNRMICIYTCACAHAYITIHPMPIFCFLDHSTLFTLTPILVYQYFLFHHIISYHISIKSFLFISCNFCIHLSSILVNSLFCSIPYSTILYSILYSTRDIVWCMV
jgi:hypothetical protein